jgi:hypothetical protein
MTFSIIKQFIKNKRKAKGGIERRPGLVSVFLVMSIVDYNCHILAAGAGQLGSS